MPTYIIGRASASGDTTTVPEGLRVHIYGPPAEPLATAFSSSLGSLQSTFETYEGRSTIPNLELDTLSNDDLTAVNTSQAEVNAYFPDLRPVEQRRRFCEDDGQRANTCGQGNHDCNGLFREITTGDLHVLTVR